MQRREFIGLIGGVVAWPLAARAQRSPPTVGYLSSGSAVSFAVEIAEFRGGLSETGWTPDVNVSIASAWAEGRYELLPALAADLIGRQVSVIFANSVAAKFAKNATSTIPIVFTSANDPVEEGLVASIGRPGGNVTGVSVFFGELGAKRLELLRELAPGVRGVALLVNPSNPSSASYVAETRRAVNALGKMELHVLTASNDADLELAFSALLQTGASGLLVGPDPFFGRRTLIADLANRHRIPSIHTTRENVAAGGLVSYGTSLKDAYRQAGIYVGRILKGDKPSELPVLQPTKFDLVINLKTAKALGLTVPPTLLATADELIE